MTLFLESLQPYTTPGKLKNFRYSKAEVEKQKKGLEALNEVSEIQGFVKELGGVTSYLAAAEAALPVDHPWTARMEAEKKSILEDARNPKKRARPAQRKEVQTTLAGLKKDCVRAYLDLHVRARLGVEEDKKKAKLTQDARLKTLQSLVTIDLMPSTQLSEWQNQLSKLMPCHVLTQEEIEKAPVCPHCGFRPTKDDVPAKKAVSDLDDRLDTLIAGWTKTLLDNIQDPTVQDSIGLLSKKQQKLVKDFSDAGKLPEKPTQEFIKALSELLSGLEKVPIRIDDLKDALFAGGAPATPLELKARLDDYLKKLTKGKKAEAVRIVLE